MSTLFSDKLGFRSDTCEWETPQHVFDALNREFGPFTLDVCASKENAKCKRHFTEKVNGLLQDWKGKCWMNPPYGRGIGQWVAKARTEALWGALVIALLPARTDTQWFHESVIGSAELWFVKGRLSFGGKKKSGAPFPSVIAIYHPKLMVPFRGATPKPCQFHAVKFHKSGKFHLR